MATIRQTSRKIDYSIALISIFIYSFFIATIKEISLILLIPILVQAFIIKVDFKEVMKKVLKVNLFIGITFLILFLEDKKELAYLVLVRANLILWYTLSFDFNGFTLYKALNNLKISNNFSLILFFAVKYIEILFEEANRLKDVVFIRGFKAGFEIDSLKVYANLISFLLYKTVSKLGTVEDLIYLRCKDGCLMPTNKIEVKLNEIVILSTVLGVIIVYYFG